MIKWMAESRDGLIQRIISGARYIITKEIRIVIDGPSEIDFIKQFLAEIKKACEKSPAIDKGVASENILGFCIRCERNITKKNLGGGQSDGKPGHEIMICTDCLSSERKPK